MGINKLKQIVLGHRGACGYRPENTIESFELAIAQGADGVECDLVPTKDGELIIRHENWLDGSTNVSELPELTDRKRTGYSDGWHETGWFSEDFNLAELANLRAIERLPDVRPGSAKFDGQFKIPVIDELLACSFLDGKKLVIEVKHGMFFTNNGVDIAGILARKLDESDWKERNIEIVIESFDIEMLKLLKNSCGEDKKYVFLTELARLPDGQRKVSDEYLKSVAEHFDGISLDFPLIFDLDNEGCCTVSNGLIERAHKAGLSIYGWTLKAEDAAASVDEYFGKIASAQLDGIFVDQPDLLREIVDGLS